MRRLFVLLLLLAVMLALSLLQADAPSVGDPLTLAAIGFVVLAAFTVAEIGGTLGLPQVTGYIIAGVALGPGVSNVLSKTVVGEMRMFNTLALGLIALGAGLELDAKAIAKLARTLGATIAAKLVIGIALVGGALYAYETAAHPLGLDGSSQVIAVALVLATLSIGTSPAIALAVMKESRAKGRLMDLILGAAVLKDLVVVVALAIAVAIAKTLLAPDAALDSSVLVHVGKELGASVLAGAMLGGLLIAYIRFIRAEMLLFVAGVILLVAEGARALHLELLLVFIAAGFVVRTFSEYEHDLMDAISMVALPVFIVFFTIAGASIDLTTTWTLLPLALVLCSARAVAYYASSRIGAAAGGEDAKIGKLAWLGYLPQAGVTLGLVGLAADTLGDVAVPIRATGMAVVAVNLLVGPITMRMALRAAGEIPTDAEDAVDPSANDEAVPSLPGEERLDALEPVLKAHVRSASTAVRERMELFVNTNVEPWVQEALHAATETLGEADVSEGLRGYAHDGSAHDVAAHSRDVSELFAGLRAGLRELPAVESVSHTDSELEPARSDSFIVAWRKRWRRLRGRFGGVQRHVPVRRIARRAFEPRAANHCAQILAGWVRFEAAVLEELRRVALGQLENDEAVDNIRTRADTWLETLRADGVATVARGAIEAADMMSLVGGPTRKASSVRLSEVARDIEEAVERWSEHEPWAERLLVARGELELATQVENTRTTAARALDEHVLSAVARATDQAVRVVDELSGKLEKLQAVIAEGDPDGVAQAQTELQRLVEEGAEQVGEDVFAAFRSTLSFHRLSVALRGLVEDLPEEWRQIDQATPLAAATSADDVITRTYTPRRDAQDALERWLPTVDDKLGEISGELASLPTRCRDVIALTLEVAQIRLDDEANFAPDEMSRALDALTTTRTELPELATELATGSATDLARILGAETRGTGAHAGVLRSASVFDRLRRRALAWWPPLFDKGKAAFRRIAGTTDAAAPRVLRTAADIRRAVDARTTPSGIPPAYARLFRQGPLRDHRWFIGRDDELSRVLASEATWQDGGPSSLLLRGDRGCGKTTLLNLSELALTTPRVIRPTRTRWLTKASLIQCISYELGCKNAVKQVRDALVRERTVVLLDDLEHWFTLDEGGMRGLEQLLGLIVETRGEVFWIAATNTAASNVLEEVLAVSESFGTVMHLDSLSGGEIAQVIEARHRASGRELQFPRTVMGRALGRFTGAGDRDIFFGLLARVCDGRVGHALAMWLMIIRMDETAGDVHAELGRLVSTSAPLRLQVAAEARAMLERLVRYGPVDREALRVELQLSPPKLARYLRFLSEAGLLGIDTAGQVRARAEAVFTLIRGLRDRGEVS